MKISNVGSNMTKVDFNNGDNILISYDTPVAGRVGDDFVVTEKKYSSTTTKHINKYFQNEYGIIIKNFPHKKVSPQKLQDRLEGIIHVM